MEPSRTNAFRTEQVFSREELDELSRRAYVFHAKLAAYPAVRRTVAVAEEQTLDELHELLRALMVDR